MKRLSSLFITVVAVGAMAALPVYASNGHGSMQGMGQGGSMAKEAGTQLGQEIHKSTVDGYTLTYRLIDMKELMAESKGASQMDMSKMPSHHLMVFITAPDGKLVGDVKAGYLVKGPDGGEQKAMTMGMRGGQGANVDFAAKGTYEIKTKAIVGGDQRLVDEFSYEVK